MTFTVGEMLKHNHTPSEVYSDMSLVQSLIIMCQHRNVPTDNITEIKN